MKLGAIFSPASGHAYSELRDHAREAEAAGFESFWVSDHFFGGVGVPDRDCLEAWTLLAALARETKRIRLGVLVTAARYRNPALLAKIVAGVDQMSGGRVEFGLGAGWKENEYRAYGYEFPDAGTRVTQMVETLEICRRLWTEERATYHGKHYRIDDAVCAPKPVQEPYTPIWIGGSRPRVMRVAAKYADGFDISVPAERRGAPNVPTAPEVLAEMSRALDDACRALGRDRPILRSHWCALELDDSDASVRMLTDAIKSYRKIGLDRLLIAFPRDRAGEMIGRAGVKVIPAI